MNEAAIKFELEPVVAGPLPKRRRKKGKKSRARVRKEIRHRARIKAQVRFWLGQYKSEHPCACGESDPTCLDFHHVGETKNRELSDARTMEHAMSELPCCIVVCANCHRKLHAREEPKEGQMKFL
jgi:hypothetical protein